MDRRPNRTAGVAPRAGRTFTAGPALAAALTLLVAGCAEPSPEHPIIPAPAFAELSPGDTLHLTQETHIVVDRNDAESRRIGEFLAGIIGNSAETMPAVVDWDDDGQPPAGDIRLTLQGAGDTGDGGPPLGPEGYELLISASSATLRAQTHAGLFNGVQTIRQLLPPVVEYTAAYPQPLFLPGVWIRDTPRFEWRGAMLDVSRHFLTVEEVKRFVDLMVPYKLNRLHLHLSDDQGWRVEIPGWPRLTDHGGSTEVGGGPGGFYTTGDYAEIVGYAADRYVTVVPEFDVPGHTNAALASYAELNCDDTARELYTGTDVGFSSLCVEREVTYEFLDDVVREISALTQGEWFHVGGDEVEELTEEEYVAFVERVEEIVTSHGKRLVGWDEVASAPLGGGSLIQLWRPLWSGSAEELAEGRAEDALRLRDGVRRAIESGAGFILSPADRIYLDMKYVPETELGLSWASLVDERRAYDWSVDDLFGMIPEASIVGVEAPIWSETLGTIEDFEYMAFPRLTAIAEIGWTPADGRRWEDYRLRVAEHGERWRVLGVNYRRSPTIPWPDRP